MANYIVWNESKTEAFVTNDKQLAYEVRKSSTSNCYDENGCYNEVAGAFSERWVDDNCTMSELK